MDPGWQVYLESLDKRLDSLENKMDLMLEFKWRVIGGGLVISAVITLIVQASFVLMRVKS